jgi:rare lipoprotein A
MISFYADKFHGRKTASGVRFDKNALTAAHRSLPFRTIVEVTNLENGKTVTVEINDRGPYSKNRILDLSPAAARKIGLGGQGTVRAKVVVQ